MISDCIVSAEFNVSFPYHQRPQVDEEHGGQFVTCLDCGAQWSVARTGRGEVIFEQIADGDGFCAEMDFRANGES